MNNTQFYILLGVIVISIIATAITINSCNKQPEAQDTTRLEAIVKEHLHKADSLNKTAIDSMYRIIKRDSVHNITINNIFNNSTKSKNEIIKTVPDSKRIRSILSWADSIANANREPKPATEW